jgi:hypothetical protein
LPGRLGNYILIAALVRREGGKQICKAEPPFLLSALVHRVVGNLFGTYF